MIYLALVVTNERLIRFSATARSGTCFIRHLEVEIVENLSTIASLAKNVIS